MQDLSLKPQSFSGSAQVEVSVAPDLGGQEEQWVRRKAVGSGLALIVSFGHLSKHGTGSVTYGSHVKSAWNEG